MGYKKILVPLDGSTLAEQILKRIDKMVAPKAWLHLLTVLGHDRMDLIVSTVSAGGQPFSPLSGPWLMSDFNDLENIEARKAYLNKAASVLTRIGFVVTTSICNGEVADSIVHTAAEGHFDAIAIATHGRTGFGRLLLGSVTRAILATAPCPVLVLPPSKLLESLEYAQRP